MHLIFVNLFYSIKILIFVNVLKMHVHNLEIFISALCFYSLNDLMFVQELLLSNVIEAFRYCLLTFFYVFESRKCYGINM